MAAADEDLSMVDVEATKVEKVRTDDGANEGPTACAGDTSSGAENGRCRRPFEAGPSRSISMPSIERIHSSQEGSLLQKRAYAACGDLRLPSFKSLGIVLPPPEHLLTPPDEADNLALEQLESSCQAALVPRSAPALPLLDTTSRNHTTLPPQDRKSPLPKESQNSQIVNPTVESHKAMATALPGGTPSEPILARHPSSSSDEEGPQGPTWLAKAVDAAVTHVPINEGTLRALCQSQPCPISPDLGATSSEVRPVTTAFTPILEALQGNVPGCQYVDLSHVVPHHFNMALLPSSPMSTPNNPSSGQTDYFSISVFSRAVRTLHRNETLNTPVPSSPRPVVPPRSIGVTLLERYIPPSTAKEFLDLFSTEAPSVLVDRLDELSLNGGSLIFVYPTFNGASAFASKYLGPLLDPLLRTMVSIHGLTTDLSHDIGKLAAVDSMFSFEKLVRKITFLLPRLGRLSAGVNNPSCKYSLIHSSKQVVNIERATWTEWWLQQEAPHIKEVVRKYYKRGSRLPERKDVTEGGLAREVLDGVKGRSYGPYDQPRDGIEMGVFVIKRTA